MSYLCNKAGQKPLSRLLSLFTAAVVVLSLAAGMLIVPAEAETTEVTVEQMVAALNALDSEMKAALQRRSAERLAPTQTEPATEPVSEEAVPEEETETETDTEEAEEPIPEQETVPEETVPSVRDDLVDGRAFVDAALDKVRGEDNAIYLNQTLLDDINACAKAVKARTNLKDKATAAVAQVESCLYLDEAVKPNYTAAIEQTTSRLEALPHDPVYLLEKEFSYIETGIDEGALTAPTAVPDACAEIFNLEAYVENYALLTEALPKWEDTQRKITEISRGLSDASGFATAETVTLNKLKALVEQSNAVVTDLASYHSFEPVAQKALMDTMRQLGAEVDTFLYASFAGNAMEDAQQQEQLEITAEQVTCISKRLVAGYIALGIAVLAVIMGVVAEVCAVHKPKKDPIDFSVVASREDAEILQKQHTSLKSAQELQERRIDNLSSQLAQAQAQITALGEKVNQLKQQPIPQPVPPETPPKDTPVISEKQQTIPQEPARKGMLKLDYQQSCPSNSLLYLRENGMYVLYADDTVGLSDEVMKQANALKSWKNTGLLYLFNPVINGREYDPERDILPEGYFRISGIAQRAKVRKGFSDDYALEQKGLLNIT